MAANGLTSNQPATRPRIMCRKAWGFESPLPQATDATKVLVPKSSIPLALSPADTVLIDTTPHEESPRAPLPNPSGSIEPRRPPARYTGVEGYMQTGVALSNFLAHCRAQNLKLSTITWYGDKLRPFAALYPRLPLKPEPIESYLADIKGSAHTKHASYRTLKAFYNFVTQRSRKSNPMAKVSAPRCPKIIMPTLEPAELMQLLFHSTSNARDRALLTLFIDTGARAAEVATLRWQDVSADTITVTGKSSQRVIPISEETRRLLLSLKQPGDIFVLTGERGPLTRYGIYHIVRRCMRKAGITGPKLGPHRLRHSFGKAYLVAGGDVRSLQKIMGHANITTTEQYSSLSLTDTIDKHHKFTPLRAAHAAAQEKLFKEVEEVVQNGNRL